MIQSEIQKIPSRKSEKIKTTTDNGLEGLKIIHSTLAFTQSYLRQHASQKVCQTIHDRLTIILDSTLLLKFNVTLKYIEI